ncbi:Tungsten-containing aldehyde:ferredoxin oxidoreductase (EC [Olavius sp. associated proteobacterium Delta 1]|nr:Tungsten-containing aldehyde:ferredoxin oxidoreductase (EC [Olavius sp. associated proteobacterium Delta 1]
MTGGYAGKIAFVDLTRGEIQTETLDQDLARQYIGGQGLGARILFERQKKGIDPLGPENILGFTTGPLTGTKTPTGGRYMAVCKSPLTGGWGDANSGGFFGSELKAAGWDAVFVSGMAPSPQYLMVTDDKIELKDAAQLWGKDTVETETAIQDAADDKKIRIACIGPASEKLSLISGIINDRGRAAARSGVGAVMGSKKLKAVAVRGTGRAVIADAETLQRLRKEFIGEMREMGGFAELLMNHGTCGLTAGLVASGATPVKNWQMTGEQSFPNLAEIADADAIIQHQTRKYGCANCPIACGGIFNVTSGKYPVGETHKPEYETIGAFGTMCMCDDFETIIKLNEMCNRSGLDTISAGTALAFAMECFENGVISESDMDGISLQWGNGEAMIAMVEKMIVRQGFGDILADGVKIAAQKIGGAAAKFAMHVGGQEPGLHNALFLPSRGTGYVCDPTPGRHTAAAMARIDGGPGAYAPYPELQIEEFERYTYTGKGPMSATASSYLQTGASAGLCIMPLMFFGNFPFVDFFNAVTGWGLSMADVLTTGARIQTLRQCFNVREGLQPSDIKLPGRMAGRPPQEEGPVAGVTLDVDNLAREYRQAMGWDPDSGRAENSTLEKLGLIELIQAHG